MLFYSEDQNPAARRTQPSIKVEEDEVDCSEKESQTPAFPCGSQKTHLAVFYKKRRCHVHLRDTVRGRLPVPVLLELNVVTLVLAVFHGLSAIASLILFLGVTNGNRGQVETFILLAKVRVLLLALEIGLIVFLFSSSTTRIDRFYRAMVRGQKAGKNSPDTGRKETVIAIPILHLVHLLVDCFVIWRIQVFSDKMER
ncbi:uncharacterized protein LOC144107284 isoform X2 [Amblyomma americanum]